MSQRNPEAGQIEEGAVGGEQMLMTNQQSSELTEPGVGSFHNPAALITPQFAPVFVSTFQPNSQRKTLTVDQYHPLRPLAPLGFPDSGTPFFAGAKLPSRTVSSHFSRPSSSSAPSSARQAFSQTPSSSHCLSRRQQVEGEENSSGKNRHAAPVCRIHRMPSKHPRFDAQGRPRLSCLRLGGGSIGSTNSHCSSVNSFCRFFMTEAQHLTRLTRKYLT